MKNLRSNLILVFIFMFAAAIISRLIFLQVLNQDFYSALAKGQQKLFVKTVGERGEIFLQDKQGNLYTLATNKEFPLVFVSPNKIKTKSKPTVPKSKIAQALAEILNLKQDLIFEKLNQESLYVLLKNKLTDKEVEDLKDLNLPGIFLGKEKGRYYSLGELASHVSGFLGGEGRGQYGVEGYWDKELSGKKKFVEGDRGLGLFFSGKFKKNSGKNLILTIDYNIQYLVQKLLKKASQELNIEGGEIMVMEPDSGRVLALAVAPSFDPNQYSKVKDFEIFQNGAIQKIFEPGSAFKPITFAAALDQEKITPQTTYIDKGFVNTGGYTIYNYDRRVWGKQNMTEVLEKSINSGAVFVEKQIGHDIFLEYLERFGIFEPTGIDLEGEIFSQNKEFKKGYQINFATASFGQGIEMTPIQLARAFCAIANGGKLLRPYVVERAGEVEIKPRISDNNIISQKTASRLTAMLVSVVENGFAKAARIPGYYIAGKTGTAQVSFSALGIKKQGYSEKTIQSFIGFAPAFNPQFLILVKLNNPQAKTAEYSAVPIFRQLAKYIINYYQIPPDYE